MSEHIEQLIQKACDARDFAYARYSDFRVGAALLTGDGRIFAGCNVENASFGLTICAERSAACTAVAAGVLDWRKIVIVSSNSVPPCGACRQFLSEFQPNLDVLLVDAETGEVTTEIPLSVLLPHRFEAF